MGATTGGIMGGVQAIGAFTQTSANNRSIRSANASALQANAANAAYLDVKRGSDQSKLAKSFQKWVARDAVLSSSKGTYGSASSTAAQMSALANALIDSNVIDFNTRAQKNQNNSSTRNQIMDNNSRYSSPLFSAIGAGAQGFSQGYNMGNAVKEAYYGE